MVNRDLEKFMKLVKKYKKIKLQIQDIEDYNIDNKELQDYIRLNKSLIKLEQDLDLAKKSYLYESLKDYTDTNIENDDVKLTIVLPYEKEDFDKERFKIDYKDNSEIYNKYIIRKLVKGNIKYKIKY